MTSNNADHTDHLVADPESSSAMLRAWVDAC
jgi:hypothetical protein